MATFHNSSVVFLVLLALIYYSSASVTVASCTFYIQPATSGNSIQPCGRSFDTACTVGEYWAGWPSLLRNDSLCLLPGTYYVTPTLKYSMPLGANFLGLANQTGGGVTVAPYPGYTPELSDPVFEVFVNVSALSPLESRQTVVANITFSGFDLRNSNPADRVAGKANLFRFRLEATPLTPLTLSFQSVKFTNITISDYKYCLLDADHTRLEITNCEFSHITCWLPPGAIANETSLVSQPSRLTITDTLFDNIDVSHASENYTTPIVWGQNSVLTGVKFRNCRAAFHLEADSAVVTRSSFKTAYQYAHGIKLTCSAWPSTVRDSEFELLVGIYDESQVLHLAVHNCSFKGDLALGASTGALTITDSHFEKLTCLDTTKALVQFDGLPDTEVYVNITRNYFYQDCTPEGPHPGRIISIRPSTDRTIAWLAFVEYNSFYINPSLTKEVWFASFWGQEHPTPIIAHHNWFNDPNGPSSCCTDAANYITSPPGVDFSFWRLAENSSQFSLTNVSATCGVSNCEWVEARYYAVPGVVVGILLIEALILVCCCWRGQKRTRIHLQAHEDHENDDPSSPDGVTSALLSFSNFSSAAEISPPFATFSPASLRNPDSGANSFSSSTPSAIGPMRNWPSRHVRRSLFVVAVNLILLAIIAVALSHFFSYPWWFKVLGVSPNVDHAFIMNICSWLSYADGGFQLLRLAVLGACTCRRDWRAVPRFVWGLNLFLSIAFLTAYLVGPLLLGVNFAIDFPVLRGSFVDVIVLTALAFVALALHVVSIIASVRAFNEVEAPLLYAIAAQIDESRTLAKNPRELYKDPKIVFYSFLLIGASALYLLCAFALLLIAGSMVRYDNNPLLTTMPAILAVLALLHFGYSLYSLRRYHRMLISLSVLLASITLIVIILLGAVSLNSIIKVDGLKWYFMVPFIVLDCLLGVQAVGLWIFRARTLRQLPLIASRNINNKFTLNDLRRDTRFFTKKFWIEWIILLLAAGALGGLTFWAGQGLIQAKVPYFVSISGGTFADKAYKELMPQFRSELGDELIGNFRFDKTSDPVASLLSTGSIIASIEDPAKLPTSTYSVMPVMLTAVGVVANLGTDAVNQSLILTMDLLIGIYNQSITDWGDIRITTLNPHFAPGVLKDLGHIFPIHRSNPAGTTYILTMAFSEKSADWKERFGASSNITWPNYGTVEARTNDDMLAQLAEGQPGSIGYVATTPQANQTLTAKSDRGVGYVTLRNDYGIDLIPDWPTIHAAYKNDTRWNSTTGLQNLINFGCPDCWPIIGPSYAIGRNQYTSSKTKGAQYNCLSISKAIEFLQWLGNSSQPKVSAILESFQFHSIPKKYYTEVLNPALENITCDGSRMRSQSVVSWPKVAAAIAAGIPVVVGIVRIIHRLCTRVGGPKKKNNSISNAIGGIDDDNNHHIDTDHRYDEDQLD